MVKADDENKKLNDIIDKLEDMIENLKEDIEKLEKEVQDKDDTIKDLEDEIEKLKQQLKVSLTVYFRELQITNAKTFCRELLTVDTLLPWWSSGSMYSCNTSPSITFFMRKILSSIFIWSVVSTTENSFSVDCLTIQSVQDAKLDDDKVKDLLEDLEKDLEDKQKELDDANKMIDELNDEVILVTVTWFADFELNFLCKYNVYLTY